MTVTTDQFVANVKRRVTIPASQALLTNEDILAFADHQLKVRILPMLTGLRQEFFVVKVDQAVVKGQPVYKIPHRSVGRTLRDLKMVDQTGNITLDLVQYAEEDISYINNAGGFVRRGFYFRGDNVVLVPIPDIDGLTLEMWYELRPSKMVPTTDAATITNIVTTTIGTTVTCSNLSSHFGNVGGSLTVDAIDNYQGNSCLGFDMACVRPSSNTLKFDPGVFPTTAAVGNYIAIADETPVVQLPDEVTVFLETLTAMRVCHAIGDFEGKQVLQQEAQEEEKGLMLLMQPRIEGETQKIINRDGLLRRSRFNFRRGFFG